MAALREFSLWLRELGTFRAGIAAPLEVQRPAWEGIADISSM